MPEVIKARCPGCKRDLRIPADWLGRAFRCKHCRTVIHAKPKSAAAQPVAGVEQSRDPRNGSAQAAPPNEPDPGLAFSGLGDAPIVKVDRRYRRSSRSHWIALGVFFLLMALGAGAAYKFWTPLVQMGKSLRQELAEAPSKERTPASNPDRSPAGDSVVFPRRALAICV